MNEPLPELPGVAAGDDAAAVAPQSAGALLKAAREREGLHLSVLAATIKVAPAKLQALEQDRYQELPNATFTRALAQSVCRSLKIDPRPVLALLPQADAPALEEAMGRLNAPFREHGARGEGGTLARVSKPMFWAGGALLLAALIVGLLPSSLLERARAPQAASSPASTERMPTGPAARSDGSSAEGESAPAASASASAPASTDGSAPASTDGSAGAAAGGQGLAATPALAPAAAAQVAASQAGLPSAAPVLAGAVGSGAQAAAAASAAAAAPAAAGALLGLRASAPSWVEVIDADDRVLISRVLEAGEAVQLDGRAPLRVRIGNAAATALFLRGQPVDLAPHTRVNVARLELR